MKQFYLKVDDNIKLDGLIYEPKKKAKAVFIIVHGMCEHKKRYEKLLKYLSDNGYAAVIYDQRGHGKSVRNKDELGYFGKNKIVLVDDLYKVIEYVKKQYNNVPITLFGHSMGSLVTRAFMQKNDDMIDKIILCGAPTYNPLCKVAILLSNITCTVKGETKRSKVLNQLSVGSYNKGFLTDNEWLSFNLINVNKYNSDELCGFIFTNNGFKMLFNLLDNVFKKNNYRVKNRNIPMLIIGGRQDPVIGGINKFNRLYEFFKKVGYKNISKKLYDNMRHEILNEENNEVVYQDILDFISR